MPRFLHVGCGRKRKADTVAGFASDWDEISLDIDESVRPDIVDSLPELRAVEAALSEARSRNRPDSWVVTKECVPVRILADNPFPAPYFLVIMQASGLRR